MQFEASTQINAPASVIFALYDNVSEWPRWDADLKAASVEGAFVSGARGVVEPKDGPKSKVVFSEVIRNKSFTCDCKLPLCLMRFEHELQAKNGGNGNVTVATHRVTFDGLLAPLFGRLIGSGMRKSLPGVMAKLKEVAEKSVA